MLLNTSLRPGSTSTRTILRTLLTVVFAGAVALAQQKPPRGLPRQIAANGSRFEKEFQNYTYRQRFSFTEIGRRGAAMGFYREVREIFFTPQGQRSERFVGRPVENLNRMRLTEEDFRDLREVQPFVLNQDNLWMYRLTYKGVEELGGKPCFVYRLQPNQVLDGQRLLDGLIWVSREDQQLVQVSGKPVPQIYRDGVENLFPNFMTIYAPVDGQFWFPLKTEAADVLPFKTGSQAIRYSISYEDYRRFTVESSIEFDEDEEGVEP